MISLDKFYSKCSECGSTNRTFYDDGEEYPPNIKCNDCGHWE